MTSSAPGADDRRFALLLVCITRRNCYEFALSIMYYHTMQHIEQQPHYSADDSLAIVASLSLITPLFPGVAAAKLQIFGRAFCRFEVPRSHLNVKRSLIHRPYLKGYGTTSVDAEMDSIFNCPYECQPSREAHESLMAV